MIFCFDNYKDILRKIIYDRNSIVLESEEIEENMYPLINIIQSLNQLYEWYYKDSDLNEMKRVKCVELFNPYINIETQKSRYSKIKTGIKYPLPVNKKQLIILNICNDYKHFIIKNIKNTEQKHKFTAVTGHNTRCGSTRCGAYQIQYIVTDNNGDNHDIISIIDQLIIDWNNI